MEENQLEIRDIATAQAQETVKAIAVAEKMGLLNSEEDLTMMIAAGIETALEEFEKSKN